MTNNQHGQVPEALRLANVCSNLTRYSMDAHLIAAELRRQHTRIAELEAQIEALSGVQALSAAPAVPAGWKAVPVNPTPEMWKAAKSVPDPNPPYPPHYGLVWDAMLAASPTPTAEQQAAPKAAPAPLSEMPYEKRKAIQEGEQIGASDAWFHARHNMLDTLDRRNVFRAGFVRGWNAALAAQGGE